MENNSETEALIGSRTRAVGVVSARERDLDNFLLEELSASKSFQAWVLTRLATFFDVPSHARLEVGKNPRREVAVGQTDISVAYFDEQAKQVALLLIESKVALGFQPGQPDRYKLEVEAARKRTGRRHAAAIVVAPRSNRKVTGHPHFDETIHIEEIIEHLRKRIAFDLDDSGPPATELRARLEKKFELLEYLAGKRAQPNWSPNPVPDRLSFMELYRRLALQVAPGLTPTASSGGSKATTVLFTGLQLPGLRCDGIRHDFGKAQRASLILSGAAAAKERLLGSQLLPPGARVDATDAGALLIRLGTPPLIPSESQFEKQRTTIKKCIARVLELETWARAHAEQLPNLVRATVPSRPAR